MTRTCFFCHKPLPIEQRATVFCSLRCQELEARLRESRPGIMSRPAAAPPPVAQPKGSRVTGA